MGKLGIKETLDVFDFVENAVKDLTAARKNDGTIDLAEWMRVSVQNVPGAISAFIGADRAEAEMKDLDSKELEILATRGVVLAQCLIALLIPSRGKKS